MSRLVESLQPYASEDNLAVYNLELYIFSTMGETYAIDSALIITPMVTFLL